MMEHNTTHPNLPLRIGNVLEYQSLKMSTGEFHFVRHRITGFERLNPIESPEHEAGIFATSCDEKEATFVRCGKIRLWKGNIEDQLLQRGLFTPM